MIDGSEKRNRRLAFELQNSHVCEKRSKGISSLSNLIWNEHSLLSSKTRTNAIQVNGSHDNI